MVKISNKTNDVASTESIQEIQISSFSSDWKILALKDAVEYIDYGYSQAIPKVPPENGIKIVSTADINRDGELLYSHIRKVEAPLKTIARLTLRDGDVLFNWRNSANLIGKTTVFEEQQDPHIFASFILRLRCDEIISHNYYIKHLLNYFRYRGIFENLARRAVNQANYNKNEISVLKIPIPPIEEQRKIARVLSLVQNAIAQQEQLVTLTTELKKALMQKLFTEGTGNEPQKMTEIGLLPESWDVIPLVKIAKIGNGATPKKDNHEYWINGNIPWLTSTKIHESIITSPDQYVTQKAVEECHLPLVRAGSLLVAITGQGKTLGNSALVEFDTRINQHLAYIQFNEATVVPIFILAFLQSRYEHFRQIARAGGSTKAALTCGFLKSYPVPLPTNQQEQLNIGQVFSSLNNKISAYESKIILLQDLFRTLLHQLMTAQIRVDDLNLSALNLEPQGGNE